MRLWKTCIALAAIACTAGPAGHAHADGELSAKNFLKAVQLDKIRLQQQSLWKIARKYAGTRASGTRGYDRSAEYVFDKLRARSPFYRVSMQNFTFPFFQENAPSEFERTAPTAEVYTNGPDFVTMEYSGSGEVTGTVQNAGGIVLPPTPDPSSASGCTAADFAGFTAGNIALIQRGTCTFEEKAANAQAAGAVAVIIFNEGNPGRTDAFIGTLGRPFTIPAIFASFAVGEELAGLSGPTVRIETDTRSEDATTSNVIAETRAGRKDRVVVVTAHLDSVIEGPGINDNGSGAASVLEIAIQLEKLSTPPRNQVRFIFFGAEEAGLLGSEHYVSTLSDKQIEDIALNLNFDMLGSPNGARFVYDGDGSDTPDPGPNGSGQIERLFLNYFAEQGLATKPTAFDGRSDYGPFIAVGIPAGGLFSGAEEIKTADDVRLFGGTAGVAFDPCYHQACDTINNANVRILDELADAAAHSVLKFAMTKSEIPGTSAGRDRTVAKVPAKQLPYKGRRLQK